MQSHLNHFILMTIIIILFSGCSLSGESEIEVTVENDPYSAWGSARVLVQSVVDETAIRGVVINRGNCATHDYGELAKGKNLKYGQSFKAGTLCKLAEIREVEVTTEKNTYTFTFD